MLNDLTSSDEYLGEQPAPSESSETLVSRARYVILQSLVGVMLAYQLLFGAEPIATRTTSECVVGGLVLLVGCLLAVPASFLQAAWFSGTLIAVDTALVTGTIYL